MRITHDMHYTQCVFLMKPEQSEMNTVDPLAITTIVQVRLNFGPGVSSYKFKPGVSFQVTRKSTAFSRFFPSAYQARIMSGAFLDV